MGGIEAYFGSVAKISAATQVVATLECAQVSAAATRMCVGDQSGLRHRYARILFSGTTGFDLRPSSCKQTQFVSMAYAAPHHGFRTFVIVWFAQSLSVIGSGMTGFALNVYLAQVLYPAPEQKPELALAFTVLNLGFTIPFVFGGPLAGAWADRHDRKQIMIVTNTANGLISLLTVFLMLSASLQLWVLVSIGVLAAAAGAFHLAAFDASYAMLVPDSLLPRANGMMQTTWSISGIVSPALAAFMIALPALLPREVGAAIPVAWMGNGTPLVIAIDSLTFFLCTAVLLLVHVPSPTRSDLTTGGRIEQSLWADVREGAIYIRHRPPLLWLVATFSVANLTLAPAGVIIPCLSSSTSRPIGRRAATPSKLPLPCLASQVASEASLAACWSPPGAG
jgi:DHA3 family macrolide efflux protein-like MFS transporter